MSLIRYHYTAKRKAEILRDIAEGRLTAKAAQQFHNISPEELASWWKKFETHGIPGLAIKAIQKQRHMA